MTRFPIRAVMAAGAVAAATFAGIGGAATADKVLICHGTASDPNPWVLISVDASAVNGHFDGTAPGHGPNNHPDFFPAPGADCKDGPGGGGE